MHRSLTSWTVEEQALDQVLPPRPGRRPLEVPIIVIIIMTIMIIVIIIKTIMIIVVVIMIIMIIMIP